MRIGTKMGDGRRAGGFSVPSFGAGLVLGAVVAVVAVSLVGPGATDGAPEEQSRSPAAPDAQSYEFWKRLPSASVAPDTAPYETGAPMPAAPRAGMEYLVQAGAFHGAEAAQRRQAELILADLPAITSTIGVDDGVLYRVIVGPFESRAKAQEAMGQLRRRNIAPLLLEKPAITD